jgi:uncharacterized protein
MFFSFLYRISLGLLKLISYLMEVESLEFMDVNCMIGEWAFGNLRFQTSEDLHKEMVRLHIKRALVFHSRAWLCDPVTGNHETVAQTGGNTAFIPVMVLTPLLEQEFGGIGKVQAYIRENRIGAVRLFPNDQSFTLNRWNVDKLFSFLNEFRVPVLIECRPVEGSVEEYFSQVFDLAKAYPQTPILLLAVGYRNLRVLYPLFETCSNVFIDTSTFITFRGLEDMVRYFGSGRILFGSRMPFQEGGVSVGRILYADLPDTDKENIAGRNLASLLEQNRLWSDEGGGISREE